MHPSNKKKDIDIRLKMFIFYKLWYSENANDLFEAGVKDDYFVTTTLPQRKNGHLNNFIYAESILKRFFLKNTLIVNEAFCVSIFARLSGTSQTQTKNGIVQLKDPWALLLIKKVEKY